MPDIRDAAVQRAIADAYIANGGNQEQAVVAAGYSQRYARSKAYRLMAHEGVQQCIRERNNEMASGRIADMEEINAFWTETMRNPAVERKDRLKASELRARAAGGFEDKVRLTGAVPVVICGGDDIKD